MAKGTFPLLQLWVARVIFCMKITFAACAAEAPKNIFLHENYPCRLRRGGANKKNIIL
jgi:hypothetical protein